MKGGHVLSLNYQLKSDMDLRKERKLAEEAKQKAAEPVSSLARPKFKKKEYEF